MRNPLPWEMTRPQGKIAADIRQIAEAIMQRGWRVTSILRPTGSHSLGIALDAAPMVMHTGGFGPKTAQLIWNIAKTINPGQRYLALSEPDHVHLQHFDQDILGIQYPGRPHVWYDPITLKETVRNA